MFHLEYLPEAASSFAGDIDHLMWFIYVVVGSWFVAAEALLFFFILRFRAKPGKRAAWLPGTGRSIGWVLGPIVLVLICDLAIEVAGAPVWEEIKIDLPEQPDLEVRITGRQFQWLFTYPGKDGEFDTIDDFTEPELFLPLGGTVVFHLESNDVLHAFYVPELRLKQDAIPGRSIPGWFQPTREGSYTIACAELCGKRHSFMESKLHVLAGSQYQAWLAAKE